ncbi:MAG: DNA-binding domain-containing protein [Pseudomonadota bacterium]
MSTLSSIQSDFQDYVIGTPGAQAAILEAVDSQFGLHAQARLAIYHNAYRIRMREALRDAYDKTWTYVGDDLFDQLASTYLAAHPSGFRNLRWFGDCFAAHLAELLPEHPIVAELAALEWTLGLAFDAEDATALDADSLRELAPEAWDALAFALHPSAHLLEMKWNTAALWQALHDGGEPPEARMPGAPQEWLVWRRDQRPHFRSLDAPEADALRCAGAGEPFGALCAQASDEAAMLRMAGYLQSWLAQGLLRRAAAPPCAVA